MIRWLIKFNNLCKCAAVVILKTMNFIFMEYNQMYSICKKNTRFFISVSILQYCYMQKCHVTSLLLCFIEWIVIMIIAISIYAFLLCSTISIFKRKSLLRTRNAFKLKQWDIFSYIYYNEQMKHLFCVKYKMSSMFKHISNMQF